MDGKLGLALGYAHMESPYQAERWNSWGYPTDAAGNLVIGGAKPYVQSSMLKRDGVIGVLEFKPRPTASPRRWTSSIRSSRTTRSSAASSCRWSGAACR
jgi:hypothetical protein